MDLDTKLSIPPQVMTRLVGEETVVLDLSTGIYFGVSGVAQVIWSSIANGDSLREAALAVIKDFEVDESTAQADVLEFAKSLIERGLLIH